VFQAVFQGKDLRMTIGGPEAWPIPQAQSKARELQRLIDGGKDPRDLKRDALAVAMAKQVKKLEEEKYTLKNLLTHYCDHLEALKRRSHKDARSIFALHVNEAWPKVAALPANQVTYEHVADMMRRLLEAGKGRTSNKLRSYLRAAYQVAKASRSKASISVAFKAFNIINNPAADTEPDESQNKADKKPLSAADMRAYWKAIKSLPGFKGAVLRLHLLTGAQRIEQLVNLKTADVTENTILLYDGKGRPGKSARPHLIPLIPLAAAALVECKPQGVYALSTDGGTTHLSASTFSDWASAAVTDIPDFAAKRIRSGVETVLASLKVSKDDRGRLQSHGISGVQARHYDGHEYTDEKRAALEMLFKFLEATDSSNVIPIRGAA
jgi:integrase